MYFRWLGRLVIGLTVATALIACSVPLPSPDDGNTKLSIDQLIEGNHFRAASAALNEVPVREAQDQLRLSRVQLGLGQFAAAMDSAEKALNSRPDDPATHVQVAAVAGRTAEHASMFKQLSLAKRVKKELDEALVLDPKNTDALYGLVLFADIAPSFLGGDKARALVLARKLTELSPARGYAAQATLAHNRNDRAAEESFLKLAAEADTNSYDAHLALAVFEKKAGPDRWALADEQVCEALYVDPTRAEAWEFLSEQAAMAGSVQEVSGLLAISEKSNPGTRTPAYHAAIGFIASGRNLEVAQKLLKDYLAAPPEWNAPSAAQAHYQLAIIAEKQGHIPDALELLRTALSEDAGLEDAKRDLKRLERPSRASMDRP